MSISICAINIIIVILPILCPRIIRRININTVNLPSIKVFQQLQCMIIVCFNQCVPKITIRSIANTVNRLQIWINRLTKLSNTYKLIHRDFFLFLSHLVVADCNTIFDGIHLIHLADYSSPLCNRGSSLDRNIIKWSTFRQVFFKHQSEFLCL